MLKMELYAYAISAKIAIFMKFISLSEMVNVEAWMSIEI